MNRKDVLKFIKSTTDDLTDEVESKKKSFSKILKKLLKKAKSGLSTTKKAVTRKCYSIKKNIL